MQPPPLHPKLIAERLRGDDFTERVAQARREIGSMQTTVSCPDGDNHITIDGYGMVTGAQFADDIFDRHTEEELGELLTTMCAQGYTETDSAVTDIVKAAHEASR